MELVPDKVKQERKAAQSVNSFVIEGYKNNPEDGPSPAVVKLMEAGYKLTEPFTVVYSSLAHHLKRIRGGEETIEQQV